MEAKLTDELCIGCGEIKPYGLWDLIDHSCALNVVKYRVPKHFSFRHFEGVFSGGRGAMQSFKDLLMVKYLL